jgi:hypothetical protein
MESPRRERKTKPVGPARWARPALRSCWWCRSRSRQRPFEYGSLWEHENLVVRRENAFSHYGLLRLCQNGWSNDGLSQAILHFVCEWKCRNSDQRIVCKMPIGATIRKRSQFPRRADNLRFCREFGEIYVVNTVQVNDSKYYGGEGEIRNLPFSYIPENNDLNHHTRVLTRTYGALRRKLRLASFSAYKPKIGLKW